jgi:ring-1,2-phenylacetyl-CoA epoxidase subunit PaaC
VLLIKEDWLRRVQAVFEEATLDTPSSEDRKWWQSGGKEGKHTEHLGYLLAEMQYLQRAFPNATW